MPLSIGCFPGGAAPLAINTCVAQVLPLSLFGILISLAVVAISYMIGNVIMLEGFRNWYRTDMYETAKSIILIAVIVSALTLIGNIALAITGPPTIAKCAGVVLTGPTGGLGALYTSDLNYVCSAYNMASASYTAFKWFSIGRGLIAGTSISYWNQAGIRVPVYRVLTVEAEIQYGFYNTPLLYNNIAESFIAKSLTSSQASFVGGAFSAVMFSMLVFGTQQYLFVPIALLGLAFFLPLGILLRAVPFLRPLGALMVAIGIGLSIIYPTLIVSLNAPIYSYVATTLGIPPTTTANPPAIAPPIATGFDCYAAMNKASFDNIGLSPSSTLGKLFGKFVSPFITSICGSISAMGKVRDTIVSFIGGTPVAAAGFQYGMDTIFNIYPVFNFLFYYVLSDVLQLILLFVDIIITIILINNISQWLGGRQLRTSIGSLALI